MKKWIAWILALSMLSLSGCGKQEEPETEPTDTLPPFVMTAPTTDETVETTEETTEPTYINPVPITEPTAAPTVPPTEAPTEPETQAQTEAPAEETEAAEPSTEAPTEPPTEETEEETEETEPPFPFGVIVGTSAVKVREGPTFSTRVVKKIPKGEYVMIYQIVQMDNQYWGRMDDGWISMNYIRLEGEAPENTPGRPIPGLVIHENAVNIRSEPTVNSEKVATLHLHDVVKVYEVTENLGEQWAKIEGGWVALKFLKLPQDPPPLYTDWDGE